jgi:transposase
MAKHRTHSIEFKRQVVQDYLGGETLYGLAKRREISCTLIRVWLAKHCQEPTSAGGVCRASRIGM